MVLVPPRWLLAGPGAGSSAAVVTALGDLLRLRGHLPQGHGLSRADLAALERPAPLVGAFPTLALVPSRKANAGVTRGRVVPATGDGRLLVGSRPGSPAQLKVPPRVPWAQDARADSAASIVPGALEGNDAGSTPALGGVITGWLGAVSS
jgi:hypothetical protein